MSIKLREKNNRKNSHSMGSLLRNGVRNNLMSTCKINCLTKNLSYSKMNSKWISDLNTKYKIIIIEKENIGDNLVS